MSDDRSNNRDRFRRRRVNPDQSGSGQDRTAPPTETSQQRRRTSYVPRQGSARPRRFTSQGGREESRSSTSIPARRAQQPPYRRTSSEELGEPDDRPLDPEYVPRRKGRAASPAPPDRYRIDDDEEYTGTYDDSFIDEEDWYEEEIAAGAARRRPPRNRRGNTPSISIPRPRVPTAMREAAMMQDQNAIILSAGLLLSVLLMALFASNRADTLAPGFATHISASGLQEHVRSESALWELPLMAGAMFLMNGVLAWFMAQRSRFISRFFLITVVIVHVLVWVAFLRIAY